MDKKTRSSLIKIFNHMKERCYDETDRRYADWGGRGIRICQEWLNDREKFIDWAINNGYKTGLSIDRIDNDGDYCPENCRWVTLSENNQNRRSCRFYTLNGKTQNLQQWCDEYNISRSMVNKRLAMGWDFEKALTTPKKTRNTTDLIGKRYGRLIVVEFSHVGRNRKSYYKCLCDCGNYTITDKTKLDSGHTSSCGCLQREAIRKTGRNNKGRTHE